MKTVATVVSKVFIKRKLNDIFNAFIYSAACVEETENKGSRVVAMQTVTTREEVEAELQGSFQVWVY